MTASLFASSTTPNLALIATVQEVDADGTATTLSSGTVLGGLRENDPARSWVEKNRVPVRPYGRFDADTYVPAGMVNFLIWERFASIKPGSKLRLVLTTQAPARSARRSSGLTHAFRARRKSRPSTAAM
jgi:hypothetical protein